MDHLTTPGLARMCEFCNVAPGVKRYDAAPALIPFGDVFALVCDPEWNACAICAEFIDQRRWDDLTVRVPEAWVEEYRATGVYLDYEHREGLKQAITLMHLAVCEAMGRTA